MKAVSTMLIVLFFITCSACRPSTVLQSKEAPEQVTIITVECTNNPQVTRLVDQLLRMARVADRASRDEGSFRSIQARYRSLSARQEADVEEQLRQTAGVLSVEVKKEQLIR